MSLSKNTSASQEMLRWFEYAHLPPHLREISKECHNLATSMVNQLPDGDQLQAGLWDLLRAKDCFVRARLDDPKVERSRRLITRLPPHAMVTPDGDVFYPDSDEDVRYFAKHHNARHIVDTLRGGASGK